MYHRYYLECPNKYWKEYELWYINIYKLKFDNKFCWIYCFKHVTWIHIIPQPLTIVSTLMNILIKFSFIELKKIRLCAWKINYFYFTPSYPPIILYRRTVTRIIMDKSFIGGCIQCLILSSDLIYSNIFQHF